MSILTLPGVSDVLRFGSQAIGGVLSPLARPAQQLGNANAPNELPSPSQLMGAWQTGWLSDTRFRGAMLLHGINTVPDGTYAKIGGIWEDIIRSIHPQPSLLQSFQLYQRGYIDDFGLIEHLEKLGFKDDTINFRMRELRHASLDFTTLVLLLNRSLIDEDEFRWRLRQLGYEDKRVAASLRELARYIPPPTDLVRFMLRDVADPGVVGRYGLASEFEEKWRDRLQRWTSDQGISEEVMRYYWYAHWQFPSPTQLYQMLHRLRPDRVHIYEDMGLSPEPVNVETVRETLGINDYAPGWRDRLTALSYHVITRVDVRRMYKTGIVDFDEMLEIYMDMGYTRTDARRMAEFTRADIRLSRMRALVGNVRARGRKLYLLGVLSQGELAQSVYRSAITSEQDLRDFDALPFAEQQRVALADPNVGAYVASVELESAAQLVTKSLAAIRKRYLKGRETVEGTYELLDRLGISQERQSDYLEVWRYEFLGGVKEASQQQVLQTYESGLISEFEARVRLGRMLLSDESVDLIIARSRQRMALEQRRAELKTAKEREAQQRARERLLKQLEAEHRKQRTELARTGSPAQLHRWFVRGYIREGELASHLERLDYPPDEIARRVRHAQEEREEYLERQRRRRSAPGGGSPPGSGS